MSLYHKLKEAGTEYVTWKIHTFTGSGTFQITSGSGKVDTLIVAGGGGAGAGGGGSNAGAGGGAGGMIYTIGQSISSGNHNVTVGTGGVGGIWSTTGSGYTSGVHAVNGLDSVFNGVTASGGGGGGQMSSTGGTANTDGNDGGSGGGGGISNGVGGTATSGQGNNGGSSAGNVSPYKGAGGGGAGAAGAAGSSGTGVGGAGLSNSITGNAVIYAGGGGGGGPYGNSASGSGNAIGGGGAAVAASGFGTNQGQSGKTGIVIIKYDSSNITATGGTVTTISEYTPMKQRFVENFTGTGLDINRWQLTHSIGNDSNSPNGMADSIDGGWYLTTHSSNSSYYSILNFNGKRQFNPISSAWIAVTRNHTTTDTAHYAGLHENSYFMISASGNVTKYQLSTRNDTEGTGNTDTSINSDTNWHTWKAQTDGTTVSLYGDGVLEASRTGYIPSTATGNLEPFFQVYTTSGGTAKTASIRYFEAYNT